jgi:3-hydroxyisobutyrate dehydrogenase-like beta-hydroxyacid dehydrogenase
MSTIGFIGLGHMGKHMSRNLLKSSNRMIYYNPGFACALMSKDLSLSQQVAINAKVASPLGALATSIFTMACHAGLADQDMSAVVKFLAGEKG